MANTPPTTLAVTSLDTSVPDNVRVVTAVCRLMASGVVPALAAVVASVCEVST